jgi:hypothetical protein
MLTVRYSHEHLPQFRFGFFEQSDLIVQLLFALFNNRIFSIKNVIVDLRGSAEGSFAL